MSVPTIHSSFGPPAWGALDALSPAAAPAADAGNSVELRDALFARHDDAAPLGVSTATLPSTAAEFRDQLLACLCQPS